ncbi:MAG: hypothetical protein WCG79_01405, partial [Verrucomicrobiota bacterium]
AHQIGVFLWKIVVSSQPGRFAVLKDYLWAGGNRFTVLKDYRPLHVWNGDRVQMRPSRGNLL